MSQPLEPPPLETFPFFQSDWAGPQHAPTPTRAEIEVIDRSQMGLAPLPADWRPVRPETNGRETFGPPPDYIEERWDRAGLDWHQVKALRVAATNEMAQQRPQNASDEDERELGRRVIADMVQRFIADEMQQGIQPAKNLTDDLSQAVFDALFGLGRLQPLIDSKWIENIEIHGHGTVHIELVDGTLVDGPPIADSDEELIEDLQFWASRSRVNPRPFSPASPTLNLPLGESARLAAMAWVTPQPVVTIRLHRLVDVDFDDLVQKDTLSSLMADFLSAVVLSGNSIVVSGAQGAGKTTLCRALCAALPPTERIITFETDRELHLDKMPEKHPRVFSVEARQGSGEFRPDGREAGTFELIEGLREALRHNADRLLVGEVRGGEIIAMIQAMQSGTGSISTTHARSARDTFNKLVTCCLEVPGISEAYANRTIASAINYVAFIRKVRQTDADGRVRRVRKVTEIVALELTTDGVAFSDIFTESADGSIRPHTVPPYVDELVDVGFDYNAFTQDIAQQGVTTP